MSVLFLNLTKLSDLDATMVYMGMIDIFSDLVHEVYVMYLIDRRQIRERKEKIELLQVNLGGNYFSTKRI